MIERKISARTGRISANSGSAWPRRRRVGSWFLVCRNRDCKSSPEFGLVPSDYLRPTLQPSFRRCVEEPSGSPFGGTNAPLRSDPGAVQTDRHEALARHSPLVLHRLDRGSLRGLRRRHVRTHHRSRSRAGPGDGRRRVVRGRSAGSHLVESIRRISRIPSAGPAAGLTQRSAKSGKSTSTKGRPREGAGSYDSRTLTAAVGHDPEVRSVRPPRAVRRARAPRRARAARPAGRR